MILEKGADPYPLKGHNKGRAFLTLPFFDDRDSLFSILIPQTKLKTTRGNGHSY
jgi:hypothetical protein